MVLWSSRGWVVVYYGRFIHTLIVLNNKNVKKLFFFVMREIDENNEVLYTVKPVSFNTNFLIFFYN